VERLVCEMRQRLVQTRYAQQGTWAIQWQLRPLGVQPLPEIWTIHRILHRHGLAAQRLHQVHQRDVVGPRSLTGGERFYGVHLIDIYSHHIFVVEMAGYEEPWFLVTSALELSAGQVGEAWTARFRQKDGFRDHKQRLGIGECRAWTKEPILRLFQV
jgi:transposase InsO family protein